MASNYEKIRADNIRGYGENTYHLALLERLYTDRTHFVFELLQNAEDKNATKVIFHLFEDRLEVQHDGDTFDERDVRGICGVGEGTKADDLTKIGKFGIGFKSVYAYTSKPEIHSGDEHFCIEHYVRPHAVPSRDPGNGWTTLFVFWFDSTKAPQATARQEIAAKLISLTARTLLFLRKIEEIEYIISNDVQGTGTYLREEISQQHGRRVTVFGESAGKEESEEWLVFENPVPIPNDTRTVAVEIAFKLETGAKDNIVKAMDSPLYVFFPTEKKTQFGFLVQGYYRTTPARDNIPKEDDWNRTLVTATAELVVESLRHIKNSGLLTITALETMPISPNTSTYDSMFLPIVEAVRDAFSKSELLPTDDGTYVAASNAKLGRGAELRKLLGNPQLSYLYQKHQVKWLSGDITSDRTPLLRAYLINKFQIEEIDADKFAGKLSHDFLRAQSDPWFVSFYRYLLDQPTLWRENRPEGILRRKPILRLQDDQLVTPFRAGEKPNAYLPTPDDTDLPVVKRLFAEDEDAATFLKRLGLNEPDIYDGIVHNVLSKYKKSNVSVSSDEHTNDILRIVNAINSDSESGKRKVIKEAKNTPFLMASNCTGKVSYRYPYEVYRDDENLRIYFENNPGAWFINETLPDDVLKNLEIGNRPRCNELYFVDGVTLGGRPCPKGFTYGELPPGVNRYNAGDGKTRLLIDYGLDGFDEFVETLQSSNDFDDKKNRSLILWRYLADIIISKQDCFFGKYQLLQYSSIRREQSFEAFMLRRQLRETEWIPTVDGKLRKPDGLSVSDLFEEFRDAEELMKLLHINTEDQTEIGDIRSQHAVALGIPLDMLNDIELIKRYPGDFRTWAQSFSGETTKPIFPEKVSKNHDRRAVRVSEQYQEAPVKGYERRERVVRTTRSGINPHIDLCDYYTNDDQLMICQICHDEMPFRKRDGEYYFEAVELLDKELLSKEIEAQFLALCPICAAKYNEFVKHDKESIAAVQCAILSTDRPEIRIRLDKEETLKFVQVHFDDIKTVLREEKYSQ